MHFSIEIKNGEAQKIGLEGIETNHNVLPSDAVNNFFLISKLGIKPQSTSNFYVTAVLKYYSMYYLIHKKFCFTNIIYEDCILDKK